MSFGGDRLGPANCLLLTATGVVLGGVVPPSAACARFPFPQIVLSFEHRFALMFVRNFDSAPYGRGAS